MRLYLILLAVLLGAGCTKVYGPQRLDFVNTSRYTSSNRVGLSAADTLASRLYAENSDTKGVGLGRIIVTVTYQPKRNPFLYPNPPSSLSRDLIDNNPEDFVFLDSTLALGTNTFSLFTTYGVRTTTGKERWTYELRNTNDNVTASRALQLSVRRPDSLYTYQDYTLKLVIPVIGVPAGVRAKSTRRYLNLLAGLALPAYTVLKSGPPDTASAQVRAQRLIDLVVLPDGLTISSLDAPGLGYNPLLWPTANRRATLIYPTSQNATNFASQIVNNDIQTIFNNAMSGAGTNTGKTTGPVRAGTVYAFRTDEGARATPRYRYGLLLVVSIPSATTTTATAGLQLQVRMAKL